MSVSLLAIQIAEALLDYDPPKRTLNEDHNEEREVVYRDKVVKDGVLICPHCNNEIHEKGTFSDDNLKTTRHRECNGIIKFRPPDDETLKRIEQAWGIKFNKETCEWTPIERSGPPDPDEPDDYDEYD
jgi:hypothetical protein